MVSLFLAADIPLHKLNHLALKCLFTNFTAIKNSLHFENATRASIAQLASQNKEVFFWLYMKQKWLSKNILMYYWAAWIPQMKYFLSSAFQSKAVAMLFVDRSITLHTVEDVLRHLETKRENFSLL